MAAKNEAQRLEALLKLNLLDTPISESFDRITRMAAQIFDLPVAAVSLTDVDRQWFKSRVGVAHDTIPRETAPCAEVAESCAFLVIPDFTADPYYRDSVLGKNGIRFYAGAPLVTRDGYGLGALCVLGTEPRTATKTELDALRDLAAIVMSQIEMQHAFGRIEPASGLPNRLQFFDDMGDLARDPVCSGRVAVVLDLGQPHQFERYTTVMGPSALDAVVAEAARALRGFLGPRMTIYHVGRTQLAFIAPVGMTEEAYQVKLLALLGNGELSREIRHIATPVCGIASFGGSSSDPEDTLRALLSAAQDARSSDSVVAIYSDHRDQLHRRTFRLLSDFSDAMKADDQLRIVFQPRVDLATGLIRSAEVLLRWTHPELGEIYPMEFIPAVESSPLVKELTAWVLDAALKQIASWQRQGRDLPLSVNISASNLSDADFVDDVVSALARHGVHPRMLELELTESALMQDCSKAMAKLDEIVSLGMTLAIDDFGTGYSSLSYLQNVPARVVKIDRSFVKEMETTEREQTLVHSMIKLFHDLNYRVVAEGIETSAAAELLRGFGCDEGQGYLFSRPLGIDDFEVLLHASHILSVELQPSQAA